MYQQEKERERKKKKKPETEKSTRKLKRHNRCEIRDGLKMKCKVCEKLIKLSPKVFNCNINITSVRTQLSNNKVNSIVPTEILFLSESTNNTRINNWLQGFQFDYEKKPEKLFFR